jgi:hypothetical protein
MFSMKYQKMENMDVNLRQKIGKKNILSIAGHEKYFKNCF